MSSPSFLVMRRQRSPRVPSLRSTSILSIEETNEDGSERSLIYRQRVEGVSHKRQRHRRLTTKTRMYSENGISVSGCVV